MKKAINFGLVALMVFVIGACGGKDSGVKSVKIGKQIWMAQNLNDPSKGGKCYDDKPENCEKYGRLYTWEEAKKACPTGWRLPSNEEWQTLVDFAGGDGVAGKKLKAKSGWNKYEGKSGNGTDDFGFSALPGGNGYSDGSFDIVGSYGGWWSSSENNSGIAYGLGMDYNIEHAYWINFSKTSLFSVRCLQD